jgi:hypothetical protein
MQTLGIRPSGGASPVRLLAFMATAASAGCAVYDESLLELDRLGGTAGPPALVTSVDGQGGAAPTPLVLSGLGGGTGGSAMTEADAGATGEDAADETVDAGADTSSAPDATAIVDSAPSVPSLPRPIVHYKFDETAGNAVADSSGNAHVGSVSGSHTWIAGRIDNALAFDGSSAFVTAPSNIVSNLTAITIATWVEVDADTSWQRILDFGSSPTVYMLLTPRSSTTGTVRFAITVSGATGEQILDGSSALPVGVWKHVAVVLDGQRASLYIDGSLESFKNSFSLRPIDLGPTPNNWLGRSEYLVDPHFKGKLDDFRIYDRALAADQIATLVRP